MCLHKQTRSHRLSRTLFIHTIFFFFLRAMIDISIHIVVVVEIYIFFCSFHQLDILFRIIFPTIIDVRAHVYFLYFVFKTHLVFFLFVSCHAVNKYGAHSKKKMVRNRISNVNLKIQLPLVWRCVALSF